MSSILVAESPSFRPRSAGSSAVTSSSSYSPKPSSSSSPMASPRAAAKGGEGYSNAVRSYVFNNPTTGETQEIRNVWSDNVEAEMKVVRELVDTHPYVAMDTEFPGVVARPVSESYSPDYHYKSLKCNVDLLRIIQLGLTFSDANGNTHPTVWQFNFVFDLSDDMFAQDSIDLLVASGISFEDHASRGIDPQHFGELLMVSGLVLDDRVTWVSFHSGYDYAYLIKVLTTVDLPRDEKSFFDLLKVYFPTIYDIKYMTSLLDGHFGGLQRLADDLSCPRVGPEHQAGSDSLLTMVTYFALANQKFRKAGGTVDDSKFRNELYGYGTNHTVRKRGPPAEEARRPE